MLNTCLTSSASPSPTSKFVHYYGDITCDGVNIGEAHLHTDGTIDVFVADLPYSNQATLLALGECEGNYVIVSEKQSEEGLVLHQMGTARGSNQKILLEFSIFDQPKIPFSVRLLVA